MALLALILILIAWAIIGIKDKLTPSNPPIENTEEHLKIIMSLPNQKARQNYLKSLRTKRR